MRHNLPVCKRCEFVLASRDSRRSSGLNSTATNRRAVRASEGHHSVATLGCFIPDLQRHLEECVCISGSARHSGLVNTDSLEWVETAAGGVRRKMIERPRERRHCIVAYCWKCVCMFLRIGGEVARATTVVNFRPNAAFPAHVHRGGEDTRVMDKHCWRSLILKTAGPHLPGASWQNSPFIVRSSWCCRAIGTMTGPLSLPTPTSAITSVPSTLPELGRRAALSWSSCASTSAEL